MPKILDPGVSFMLWNVKGIMCSSYCTSDYYVVRPQRLVPKLQLTRIMYTRRFVSKSSLDWKGSIAIRPLLIILTCFLPFKPTIQPLQQ